jgi:ABC-type transport system involved in multi-copper enzyme maturation permease subunit
MTTTRFSLARVGWIARNTWREAIRQRLFTLLAVFAVALVASALLLGEFNFGASELKFIADFGFGALTFFGSLLAIVATAQLFFGEIENRTALTLLAKPVRRSEFMLGKFLGVWAVLLLFCALVGAALVGVLEWRASALPVDATALLAVDHGPSPAPVVNLGGVLWFVALQWLKFGVLAAATILIASYAQTNLFTMLVSFLVLAICHLQHLAHDAWTRAENVALRFGSGALAVLFPNFQLFNVGDRVAGGETLPVNLVGSIAAYGAVYVVALLGLAIFSFRHREV